ncbi:MAG: hypothetical protein MUE74_13595 [Bacteroidales bacterium]|jgi:hypothetical protein|nr:hypothetical protein [Bacteroidales bacterium]
MKKLVILSLFIGLGCISGKVCGQEAKTQGTKEQDRRGGFAVGGYDNTRTERKRSVPLPPAEEQAEKAADVEKAAVTIPAQEAAPAPVAKPTEANPEKDAAGNAYGKDKGGLEGKEFGQTRAQDAKDKQKAKKTKTKGKRR